jgi:hypothetical protein
MIVVWISYFSPLFTFDLSILRVCWHLQGLLHSSSMSFTYEEGDYFSALRWHDDTTRPIHTTFETKTSHGRNETNIMSGDYRTGSGRFIFCFFYFLAALLQPFHFLRRALGLHSVLRWGLDLLLFFSVRENLGSFPTQK